MTLQVIQVKEIKLEFLNSLTASGFLAFLKILFIVRLTHTLKLKYRKSNDSTSTLTHTSRIEFSIDSIHQPRALWQYIECKVLLNPIYPRSIYWIYIQFVENGSSLVCYCIEGSFSRERKDLILSAGVALLRNWLALFAILKVQQQTEFGSFKTIS